MLKRTLAMALLSLLLLVVGCQKETATQVFNDPDSAAIGMLIKSRYEFLGKGDYQSYAALYSQYTDKDMVVRSAKDVAAQNISLRLSGFDIVSVDGDIATANVRDTASTNRWSDSEKFFYAFVKERDGWKISGITKL